MRNRRLAIKRLTELTVNPSQVLVIHYSQAKTYDDDYGTISPLITAIVVKSLDRSIMKHFAIHYEADKANIPLEEIENSYRDLELRNLKAFNDFVKRKTHCIWVHWDMKDIHFGFEAIKHRFEKIFSGLKDRFEEIPENRKINFRGIVEDMYGEKFAEKNDQLASLMKYNNGHILYNDYLAQDAEESEFEKKTFPSIIKSLDCKVDFVCRAIDLLIGRNLKVANKNKYALFVEFVNNPVITFIGWLATLGGTIIAIATLFKAIK